MENKNYFEILYGVNVNDKVEKKDGLSYLTWSFAWAEVKKRYPQANYRIHRFDNGSGVMLPYMYDKNTGYMVATDVTIGEVTHEMWLPVMNGANKAMKGESYEYTTKFGKKSVEPATMFDVNKTIMRCLVKNLGMHGLGLYIYAGEDLPEQNKDELNADKIRLEELIESANTLDALKEIYEKNKSAGAWFAKAVTTRKTQLNAKVS